MEQQKKAHALVKKEYLLPFVLVTSLFFMWGFARAILDVLNKHFQEAMGISLANSALIQVMFYLGYFTMAIPAGLFIARNGYRKGVVLGLLLFGIGSLLFIPGEYYMSFNFFLFSLFFLFFKTLSLFLGTLYGFLHGGAIQLNGCIAHTRDVAYAKACGENGDFHLFVQ